MSELSCKSGVIVSVVPLPVTMDIEIYPLWPTHYRGLYSRCDAPVAETLAVRWLGGAARRGALWLPDRPDLSPARRV